MGAARRALSHVLRARSLLSRPGLHRALRSGGLHRPLPPLSAFLLLQGVETAALRVERHVENGRKVAEFLRSDPRVTWVNYAGFPDSPYHALARKYLNGQGCSLMMLGLK